MQKGFTLVELAIVMTIVGLLIGGILKGQELMLNARVTATIAQVRSYEAAATTFRDSFGSIPGDMAGASTRLPGCNAFCEPAVGTAGNSMLGREDWSTNWGTQASSALSAANLLRHETMLFWAHMMAADLIGGISPQTLSGATPQWGITHPQARISGGFIAGYADGVNPQPGLAASAGSNPSGLQLAVSIAPSLQLDDVAGENVMTASKAAQIDRKMDDGRPSSGFVQAFGVLASCFTSSTALVYNESRTGNDCGLLFRIQS